MQVIVLPLPADEDRLVQFWNIKLDAELGLRTSGECKGRQHTAWDRGSQIFVVKQIGKILI